MIQEIELIYELSPMQQAMLFHSLVAPGSGVYVMQLVLRLSGRLDPAAFEQAWRRVVERQGILRTAFYWEGLDKPVQVVYPEVDLAVHREPWRDLPAAEQRARLDLYLEADRAAGFDLGEAPLFRLALFELAAETHQLVWTLHHLLIDGWSLGLLLQELFTCYAAFAAGREPRLDPPLPYRDYIGWLQRQDKQQAEDFWRRSLAGFAEPALIAEGVTRQGVPARPGAAARLPKARELRLSAAATEDLRILGRRHHLTLNTLVQGAWALLLARRTGRQDVVFGSTVAGRPEDLPGAGAIIGPFINTVPVRVDAAPQRCLIPWLSEIQERQVEMRRFGYTPLYEVQTWSELPAGVALFDNIVAFESFPLDSSLSELLPDLTVTSEEAAHLSSNPLDLSVVPGTDLVLQAHHDASRLDGVEALLLLEHLATLLRSFVADPAAELGMLPMLLDAERQQVLAEWNEAATAYPRQATIFALFAAIAAEQPTAPAIEEAEGGEIWSYGRLAEAASRLARYLMALGVERGARVGVAMERSAGFVVGVLGALAAGGAYVPLDPSYPDERLAFMLADTAAAVVLVHGRTRERLARLAGAPRLVCLDADRAAIAAAAEEPPEIAVTADDLSHVIFTSGSTGRPKGVAIPHRGIVRLVRETNYAQLGPGDRMAFASNVCFDASTFEIWAALLNGGALVVIPREVVLSPRDLAARFERQRISAFLLTTALFNQVARDQPDAFAGVRHALFGGEAADPAAVRQVLAARPPLRLINAYGPTEGTMASAWFQVTELAPDEVTVPIGGPLANTTLYVLDRWQGLAAPGQTGELLIGGDGLAWGYLNRPELTGERFVPHPWSAEPGGRLYRTGDLVRRRRGGVLEFAGRIDQQVKIRGFRIEPGEIEAVLATSPDVRECAVTVRQDGVEKRLVAFVAGHARETPEKEGLRRFLQERLPVYMVPAVFVVLESLPKTPNGKIDRKALAAMPVGKTAADATAAAAPRDALEEALVPLWADVLGIDQIGQIGVHDSFFALGGHSLLAMRLASRVREALGLELPVAAVFAAPTIAGLAEHLRAAGLAATISGPTAGSAHDPMNPTDPTDPADPPPLSFGQQRLWFIDRLEPDSAAYNVAFAVRLTGGPSPPTPLPTPPLPPGEGRHRPSPATAYRLPFPPLPVEGRGMGEGGQGGEGSAARLSQQPLNIPALAAAFGEIVRRHAVLRATFSDIKGEPVQRIAPPADPASFRLPCIDLEALGDAAEAVALELAAAMAERRLDLARGPLLHVCLLRLRDGEHLLSVLLHHIVSDGWSMGLLVSELTALYAAFSAGRPSPLPRLALQYFDFARWQRQWLSGAGLEAEIAWWRERLAGLPPRLDLPRPDPARSDPSDPGAAAGFTVVHTLPAAVASAVRTAGLENGATPFMVMLAGFQALLGRLAGTDDLAVGVPVSGRTRREVEGLIGFFVNSVVVRADLSGDPNFREFLGRMRDTAIAAQTHQEVPFERLVEALQPERSLGSTPLFQVMFSFQNAPQEALEAPGLIFRPVPLARHVAHFDLSLAVQETEAGLETAWEARSARFDRQTVLGFAERFERLLTAALEAPETRLSELPLLSAAERRQVLAAGDGGPESTAPGLLHAAFEAQAERAPEAVAFDAGDGGEAVTYGELARRANRLARHLVRLGVGPESPVGVSLDSTADGLTAFLAVLAAGGVYLPLDPAYPEDRRDALLRDAGAVVLITRCGEGARSHPEGEFCELEGSGWADLSFPQILWVAEAPRRMTGRTRLVPENLAYLIYTSGSTGVPKGVGVSHAAATVHVLRMVADLGIAPGDRVLWFASPSFDASPEQFLMALCAGATVVPDRVPEGDGAVPLGRPLAGRTVRVLDPAGNPQPFGVPGELCLGGLLARGYRGRPELTAAAFVPDAWRGDGIGSTGARLYRTGDLARLLPDGTLEFLGRIDRQVKIRGFRIEPGEAALPAPAGSAPASTALRHEAESAAPRDALETTLVSLFAHLLAVESVGIHDDFFALGGHSLLVMRLVSAVREELGAELPVAEVFGAPTVAGLARLLRAAGPEMPAAGPVGEERGDSGPPPLSFGQQRFWFLDRLEPESPAYNMPSAVRLVGRLDLPVLAAAFGEIVRRHAVLRTTFEEMDGEPVQRIAPAADPASFRLPCVDLEGLGGQAEGAARRLAIAEAERCFDLTRGPLLRLGLLRLRPEEHLLLATMHHSVSDGWSLGLLVRELKTLYAAFQAGLPSPLPELPLQYADFARWQRRHLAGARLDAEIDWWRQRLAGLPPRLELPADRPRRTLGGMAGINLARTLPPAVLDAVRTIGLAHGATPFMVVLAAFQVFLGRLAGTEDLAVGAPVSGRTRREVEGLIGFFVNSLVLRADLAGDPSFEDFLGRVRETAVAAQSHQEIPFERLVEALQPERSLADTPLYQVMFSFQNTPREPLEAPGLRFEPVPLEWRAAQLDLTLTVEETDSGLETVWEARSALFDRKTIERFADRFGVLLTAALDGPETRLSALPLLSISEREQVMAAGDGGPEIAPPLLLHAAFQAQAERSPEAIAFDDGETSLTYGELARRANQLAQSLIRLGVGPEKPVGVELERSADGLTALLAVLTAGGVYLPLDPAYPEDRRAALLRDSGAAVLITRVDEKGFESALTIPPRPAPENLAYLIYTSGSTGVPKGVGVSHGAAAIHVARMAAALGIGPGDRVLWFASPSFDASPEQILVALGTGATVVPRPAELWNPSLLGERLTGLGVTVADLAPAYWEQWVGEGKRAAGPSTLRLVSTGGEAMSGAAARRWNDLWPAGSAPRLLNEYGPTEAIITATLYDVDPDRLPREAAAVPIGRPLPGRTARVLDPHGNLQPFGVPGELCLGGLLARGYLDRPDLTAAAFVPSIDGGRLYRTGDLTRLLPDGTLEFLGRIDHQVKIRGFRIELGEIEAVLGTHPAVHACAVLVREDVPGQRFLAAYVVIDPAFAAADLKTFLSEKLPAFMLPSAFVPLDTLPLTPNGKVDRNALPAPRMSPSEQEAVPPRDELELRLVQLWEQILDIRPIGIRDDFFALGGHSLLALRLIGSVERTFDRKIALAALLEAPTIEQLARLLRQEAGAPDRSLIVPLVPPDPRGTRAPLFLVHPVGGDILCYLSLARSGSLSGPLYGIQAPEPAALPATLEAMAALYIQAVREVQPAGPYLLAGWSLGGVVAFEMARQLEAAGEEVALLALLDVPPPEGLQQAPRADLIQFAYELRALAGPLPPELSLDWIAGHGSLEALLENETLRAALPPELDADRFRGLFARFRAISAALAGYQPGTYGGRLHLVHTEKTLEEHDPCALRAWAGLAGAGAEIHTVPGDHYSFLQPPHAAVLGGLLESCRIERT